MAQETGGAAAGGPALGERVMRRLDELATLQRATPSA